MGIITDIQRFSLNDGPGIRTTVFFKGCNMACSWCHNPETLSPRPQVLSYPDRCIGCGACAGAEGLAKASLCYAGVHVQAGQEKTVSEILAEILQDRLYYQNSGGGVTLSGGEVMTQPAFAESLAAACAEQGIPVAVETNLHYPHETLLPLLPHLSLILCDLKILDPALHRQHTGVDNALVLENLRRINGCGVPFLVRTPVIPGINDNEGEIGAIAAWLAAHTPGLQAYELLNFNPLGDSKYQALGADNPHQSSRPLPQERIEALAEAARAQGIPVRIG